MTINEAIQALKYDREMITFDPTTGEITDPEQLIEDHRKIYEALGMAIEALEEKKTKVMCCTCKHWKVNDNDYSYGSCIHDEEFGIRIERDADWNCGNWEKKVRS